MPSVPKLAFAVAGAALAAAVVFPTSRKQGIRAARTLVDELAVRADGPWSRHLLLLTAEGHRSGLPRTVVLAAVEHDGETYVLPWLGHPSWLHNIRAHPKVVVDDRKQVRRAVAEEVTGRTAEAVRQAALRALPGGLLTVVEAAGALKPGSPAVRFSTS